MSQWRFSSRPRLPFVSFPDAWFVDADLYYEDIKRLDYIVLAVDEQAFAAKQAGAIAAKRMIIATNKTQNNMEATPEEIKGHPDLAKAAILAELLRWTTKNQALRHQPRSQAANLLTSRYVVTWKRNDDGTRYLKCRLTVHGFKDSVAASLDRYSGTSTRWGQRAIVATAVQNQWPMASLDVSEAFPKGFTFEEIQERRWGSKEECVTHTS